MGVGQGVVAMVDEQACVQALQAAAERLGKSPTKAEYEELGLQPAASTILRQCGGWNAAKERAGLETNPSRGSRVQEQPDDVELPDGLVWEELTQDQRWHYKNRDRDRPYTEDRKRRHRAWVYEQKEAAGCGQCGEDDGRCLDFHHREDERKWLKVSLMVTYGYAKEKLEKEIAKCDVLCANCHRLEHYRWPRRVRWNSDTDPHTLTDGTSLDEATLPDRREYQQAWLHEYKESQGCAECGIEEAASLEFHHVDSDAKEQTVSQLVVNGCSGSELLTEIQRCTVLCANCHRQRHTEVPDYVGNIRIVDGLVREA